MAHLWVIDEGLWSVLPLLADVYALDAGRVALVLADAESAQVPAPDTDPDHHGRIILLRTRVPTDGWALVADAAADVRVNGEAVSSGIKFVADRDAIRVAGRPSMFFSTETLASVVPFPGAGQPVYCPRCRDTIASGSPGVRCPSCAVWHHQRDDRRCWTYGPHCALCPQPTNLDAGFAWTPEES